MPVATSHNHTAPSLPADATGGIPQGTVTFRDGSTVPGTARLNSAGVATFQTTALAAGTHSLSATRGGDSNNFGSTSQVVTVVVGPAPATTAAASAEADLAADMSLLASPIDSQDGIDRRRA